MPRLDFRSPRLYVDAPLAAGAAVALERDQANYLQNVLRLKAGDVMVQRGTIHDWVNNGTVPCVIAFALIGAKPVASGSQTLKSQG